jgi:hypothetical protein
MSLPADRPQHCHTGEMTTEYTWRLKSSLHDIFDDEAAGVAELVRKLA